MIIMAGMKKAALAFLLVVPLSVLSGFLLVAKVKDKPDFHDIRVNPVADYVGLINADNEAVVDLARTFGSYEEAYHFVHNKIRFVPYVPPGPVDKTLEHGVGSCLGKAALLSSLYRAMGMPSGDIRMVMGIVMTPQGPADHVWLDLEHEGRCLQQDPSGMLGRFAFDEFPGTSYVDSYVMKESFAFNDTGFAVVSQLNRLRAR